MDIKEAIQGGNTVWAYSRITGLPGVAVKNFIDISLWDNEGKFFKGKECTEDDRFVAGLEAEAQRHIGT